LKWAKFKRAAREQERSYVVGKMTVIPVRKGSGLEAGRVREMLSGELVLTEELVTCQWWKSKAEALPKE
jgi:hypothetical protein